jgi:hypothetical protein
LVEGWDPLRVMLIVCEFSLEAVGEAPAPETTAGWFDWANAEANSKNDMTVAASSFISVLLSIQRVL